METEIDFVPHVSHIALQFIARHWRDVSTSKVYCMRVEFVIKYKAIMNYLLDYKVYEILK